MGRVTRKQFSGEKLRRKKSAYPPKSLGEAIDYYNKAHGFNRTVERGLWHEAQHLLTGLTIEFSTAESFLNASMKEIWAVLAKPVHCDRYNEMLRSRTFKRITENSGSTRHASYLTKRVPFETPSTKSEIPVKGAFSDSELINRLKALSEAIDQIRQTRLKSDYSFSNRVFIDRLSVPKGVPVRYPLTHNDNKLKRCSSTVFNIYCPEWIQLITANTARRNCNYISVACVKELDECIDGGNNNSLPSKPIIITERLEPDNKNRPICFLMLLETEMSGFEALAKPGYFNNSIQHHGSFLSDGKFWSDTIRCSVNWNQKTIQYNALRRQYLVAETVLDVIQANVQRLLNTWKTERENHPFSSIDNVDALLHSKDIERFPIEVLLRLPIVELLNPRKATEQLDAIRHARTTKQL